MLGHFRALKQAVVWKERKGEVTLNTNKVHVLRSNKRQNKVYFLPCFCSLPCAPHIIRCMTKGLPLGSFPFRGNIFHVTFSFSGSQKYNFDRSVIYLACGFPRFSHRCPVLIPRTQKGQEKELGRIVMWYISISLPSLSALLFFW
jgi:hypothetical protein